MNYLGQLRGGQGGVTCLGFEASGTHEANIQIFQTCEGKKKSELKRCGSGKKRSSN